MIQFDIRDNVGVVTIDRADRMNALTVGMRERLRDLFEEIREMPEVRSVLLTASGTRAFCAGADVAELAGIDTRQDFEEVTNPLVLNLHHIGKPVVCVVSGVAVGLGWSLALASDVVLCSGDAKFSQIFRNLGLVPDGGATWFLTRLIGANRAKEMVFSARFVEAEEALRLGLVQEVLAPELLQPRGAALARELAQRPTLAFRHTKELFLRSMLPSLQEHLRLEADLQSAATASEDHKSAIKAFADKQRPCFVGY